MDSEEKVGSRRGCLAAVIVAGGAAAIAAVWVIITLVRGAGDPSSTAYIVLSVIKGEKDAEFAMTEIIVGRLARKAGVPPDEIAALQYELGPISRDLPRLSEGEKERLAKLIRASVEDGHVTDDDLAAIRDYSYRSARDGDAKP